MLDITREELRAEIRADILEITTVVVDNAIRGVRKMATEDVLAISSDISALSEDVSALREDVSVLREDVSVLREDVVALSQNVQSMDNRLTGEIRRTNDLLESHIADPRAHTRPLSA
jgi:polyhydroxyalkanoate synthesis regulator phasin